MGGGPSRAWINQQHNNQINANINMYENAKVHYQNVVNNFNNMRNWGYDVQKYLNYLRQQQQFRDRGVSTVTFLEDSMKRKLVKSMMDDLTKGQVQLLGLDMDTHMSYDGKIYIAS